MLVLYGRNTSINVQKAAWALGEAGLSFEWIDKDGTVGSIDNAGYREINPTAQIPTLDDDGVLVRQSNSVVRYLARKYARDLLWPADDAEFAEANRWMDWQISDNHYNLRTVFWALIRTPPEKQDPEVIAEATAGLNKDMTLLNDHLGHSPYMAGSRFCMGDIPPGALAYRYFALPIERPSLPHLEAWYEVLQQRPAYVEMVMIPLA